MKLKRLYELESFDDLQKIIQEIMIILMIINLILLFTRTAGWLMIFLFLILFFLGGVDIGVGLTK